MATTTPPGGGIGTYIDFAILAQQQNIASQVSGLSVPGGSWAVTWGPAWKLTNSNLAYAAELTPTGGASPTIAAVVIRGTDVNVGPLGLILQAAEDLRSLEQVTIPWSTSSSARVSTGSIEAFDDITSMTSKAFGAMFGKSLSDYLTGVIGRIPELVIVGHSLGGAMTTMISLWAQATITGQSSSVTTVITPVTFAAPGIGNQAFIDLYQSTFDGSSPGGGSGSNSAIGGASAAFANTLDIVPLAWASTTSIPGLYTSHDLSMPKLVADALGEIQKWQSKNDTVYAQQSQNLTSLPGVFATESGLFRWSKEVLAQHVATNYASLLTTAGYTVPPLGTGT